MSTTACLAAQQQSRTTTWPTDKVTNFDQSDADILVLPREPIPGLATAVAHAHLTESRHAFTADDLDQRIAEASAELGLDCPAWADDLKSIGLDYLAQFRLESARLRVECQDRPGCPKFHCDNVHMRLIVTYHGPGTVYLYKVEPEQHEETPTNALVFLKGHKHPTNRCSVLHRSPMTKPGERRLVVVIDE